MEQLILIGTVALVNLMGVISPGPSFLIVSKNAVSYSRRAGVFTGLGVVLGDFVHITYCLLGIAVVISQSIILFNTLKYIGALYLMYLGWKSFRAEPQKLGVENVGEMRIGKDGVDGMEDLVSMKKDISAFDAFKDGFIITAFNPKASLMFLGIFTVIITPNTPISTLSVILLIMFLIPTTWFSLVSMFFGQPKVQSAFLKFEKAINKVFGALIAGLGIKIALSER